MQAQAISTNRRITRQCYAAARGSRRSRREAQQRLAMRGKRRAARG
jgi:hypothetical protein